MSEQITRRPFGAWRWPPGPRRAAARWASRDDRRSAAAARPADLRAARPADWRDHFPTIDNDAILCVVNDRVLHYWGADGFYRIYPTSVPLSDEMTRRGRTEVVPSGRTPEWRPTPRMLERNPALPALCRAGAGQSARRAGAEPRLAVLPDPRHQRHPQDRAAVVVGLHRAAQRAHRRDLRPARSAPGHGDLTAGGWPESGLRRPAVSSTTAIGVGFP